MIAKAIKGKGFRGAVAYDLQKGKSILLESNMSASQKGTVDAFAKEFGLITVQNSNEVEKSSPKKGELEQAIRRQEPSVRMLLQANISAVLIQPMPLETFIEELKQRDIEVKLNQASTGTISGISFSMSGVSFKGSKLGKGYTWNALQQKGLYYENGYAQRYEQYCNEPKQSDEQQKSGKQHTAGYYSLDRAGTVGNEGITPQPTGESKIAEQSGNLEKQSRIAENFARLEQELYQNGQRLEKSFTRNTGLSR